MARQLPNTPPQVAATGFASATDMAAGDTRLLVAGSFDNGTAFVNWWDNVMWNNATAPLMQGKVLQNFTAVSVFQAQDIKFWGLTNESEIHSYIIDRQNPLSWRYDQAVKTD